MAFAALWRLGGGRGEVFVRRRDGAGRAGMRPVSRQAGVVGERLLELRAGSIVLRARRRADQQSAEADSQHERVTHRRFPYRRNVAPVLFATSATILATTASISASVSVRSRGCNVTEIATDLQPSGNPGPR